MFEMIQQLDSTILLAIQQLRASWLSPIMLFASLIGNAGLVWIALGLVLSIIPKTRKIGILALSSLLVCFLCNNILLKNLVARPRPYTQLPELTLLVPFPLDFSFPSGHTCSSFAVAGSLWQSGKHWNGLRIPALILAILIALSRLYVGAHYPSDVLVGALIGLVGSALVTKYGARLYDWAAERLSRH